MQDARRFFSIDHLVSFVEIALLKPEYGVAVTHLDISLSASALQRELIQHYLPACLALTPNLVVLELTITPPISIMSFGRIPLPSLEVLKTNLAHRSVASLVAIHPRLGALDISQCGRARKCPLSTISVEHVNDLRCPAACAAALVHDGLDRLRLDAAGSATLTSVFISKFPLAMVRPCVLTVDFTRDDETILRVIAAHLPHVRNLKLISE